MSEPSASPDAAAIVEQVKESAHDWVERFARFGYAAKGLVYLIVGLLALRAALGSGTSEGTDGALEAIREQPFGRLLLGITALGLAGYVAWRFVQAALDTERNGNGGVGLAKRAGYVISGLSYAALTYSAANAARGAYASNGESQREWTAWVMGLPLGQWMVGMVGAVIVGVGLFHFRRAYRASFMRDYEHGELSADQRRWIFWIGRLGLTARGITFCLIGIFVVRAAWNFDPQEAQGLGAALSRLARQPYGPWMLGAVAVGFIAYGVYCFSRARYRRFVIR